MSDEHKKNFILAVIMIVLLALLALTGCAKVSVTPPAPRPDAPQNRVLSGDHSQIWSRAIGWFDAHEVEITDIDERSGIIRSRLPVAEADGVIDCGTFRVNQALSPPDINREAQVRIQMRGGFSHQSTVLVSVTGSYRFEMIDTYEAQTITRNGPCVSLGSLERDIFAFLTG